MGVMNKMSNYFKKSYKIAKEGGKKDVIFKKYKDVLAGSFIFKLSNPLTLLLSLTDTDLDEDELRLPFQDIFLDCKLEFEDWEVFGLTLSQIQVKDDVIPHIYMTYLYHKENEDRIVLKRFDELDDKGEYYEIYQKIKLLIVNFLDFVNNPEMEFIERKLRREEMNTYESKFSKGVSDIVITGKLKRYVGEIEAGIRNRGKMCLRNAFWVKGHWIRYEHERFKDMRGKKAWCMPFIKGLVRGSLIKKGYMLKDGSKDG